MKVLLVVGTRPELIRLSRTIPLLEAECELVLVDTQQNYDDNLRGVFYRELGIRKPDLELGARGSFGEQAATIFTGTEKAIQQHRPDRFLVLGDTNSSIAALIAARMGVPVFHVEAGNRGHDPRSPEETNRRAIDHTATVNLCYTERARMNLVAEGLPLHRTLVVGNPIGEVIAYYSKTRRAALQAEALMPSAGWRGILATVHRAENVDDPERLKAIMLGIAEAAKALNTTAILSIHPHTKKRLNELGVDFTKNPHLTLSEPLGFIDFVALERACSIIVTDSGTIQEEAMLFGKPCVVARDATERPETVELGATRLTGANTQAIVNACQQPALVPFPQPPEEYRRPHVSATIVNAVLGHLL